NQFESTQEQIISGQAKGEFQKGDIVSFTLNGHDYSAAVAADGTWSVKVAGADLAAETNIHATLVAHDAAGNAGNIVADHGYRVDTILPVAQLTIDAVTEDNVLNIEESKVPQTISGKATGEFREGDIVSFKLNGTTYSAAVAANGKWSVEVAGSDLAKATNIHATLIAHDVAGNTASVVADHPYTVAIDPQMPTLSIHVIAGD
ncbi:Ig-like domain-containing protein, partial [Pseudomonas sp. PDM33]